MSDKLKDDLEKLVAAEVIDTATAGRIREYYSARSEGDVSRQMIIFGILGSLLVGLGIILIIAHNWDNLSRTVKAGFTFLPLIIGQVSCFYALYKKDSSTAWKEASAIFLFFAIGASISLISQIYNLPGEMSSYLFTWMLLAFPLIYLMGSSISCALFLIGITTYACEMGYWQYNDVVPYWYWVMLIAALPFYIIRLRKNPESNFTHILNWMFPLSVIISLGTWAGSYDEGTFVAYVALLSLLFIIGRHFINPKDDNYNSFQILGSLGILILLIVYSFNSNWREMISGIPEGGVLSHREFWVSLTLSGIALCLLVLKEFHQKAAFNFTSYAFVVFIVALLIASQSTLMATIMINLFLLAHGVMLVRQGAFQNHLGIINYGLLIITALITARFFDVNISFIFRGLLFLAIGFAFFLFNYRTLKRRRAQ